MRKTILPLIAAGAMLAAISPADARDGCGPGFHAGPHGRCWANRVGGYYHGQGYWDGHRYWHNRYRYHDGWRYR